MRPKLHIHSDSPIFGGAENMVGLILNDPKMQDEFQISFSYRQTFAYERGLAEWVGKVSNSFPLRLPTTRVETFCSNLGKLCPLFRLVVEPFVLVSELIKVTHLLIKIRPDILHLNNGGYPGALSTRLAPIAARLAGVKNCVMVVNNLAVPYNRMARILEWPLDRLSKKFVSIYLTASDSAAKRLRQVLSLPSSRTAVIANGITRPRPSAPVEPTLIEAVEQAEGTVKLGIAALFEARKGHAVLFNAFRQVIERASQENVGNSYSLFVQASPRDFEALKRLIEENDISSHVKMLDVSAVNLIDAVDIFVLPSTQDEDFPNVNLIAMALKKPIISTNLAGIPTQVTSQFNGLIVEPGDVGGLATAIETLGCNRTLIKALGSNGLTRYEEKYSSQAALENYYDLYSGLLAESDS